MLSSTNKSVLQLNLTHFFFSPFTPKLETKRKQNISKWYKQDFVNFIFILQFWLFNTYSFTLLQCVFTDKGLKIPFKCST